MSFMVTCLANVMFSATHLTFFNCYCAEQISRITRVNIVHE